MSAFVGPEINDGGIVALYDSANPKSWGPDGSKWKDVSKNSNDGSIIGPIHSQGPFPGAGSVFFDGQGDHSQLDVIYTNSLSADFDLSGNISSTVECWVYLTAYPGTTQTSTNPHYGNATIFSIKNSTNAPNYYLYTINTSGQLRILADYGSGFPTTGYSTSTLSLNTWYHIAWVRDSGNNRFFLNGTEITSEFSTPNASGMIGSGNSKISIGADYYAYPTLNWLRPLTGYISNFRVVNGTALYTSNFTPQLSKLTAIPNTKLLTCQGSSISDASYSVQSLSLNGGPTATYNDVSYFDFDGTSSLVVLTDDTSLNPSYVTLSVWVKFDNVSNNRALIAKRSGTGAGSYWLYVSSSNEIMFDTYQGSTQNRQTHTYNFSTGTWYNITATYSSSAKVIYVNGSSVNSTSGGNTLTSVNNNVAIGRDSYNAQYYLDGQISNVTIYNRALTSTEVAKNFNALRGRYGI